MAIFGGERDIGDSRMIGRGDCGSIGIREEDCQIYHSYGQIAHVLNIGYPLRCHTHVQLWKAEKAPEVVVVMAAMMLA